MKPAVNTFKKNKLEVTRDASLDKYDDIILFPEKVKKAKETIARVGLPEKFKNKP